MGDSLESNCSKGETVEKGLQISRSSKITDIHPLAFTIEFDDQKFDESKKSKVQERLSAFSLRHRRNPSLPDFREVKNVRSCSIEKVISPVSSQHVPVLHKKPEKSVKTLETRWKSTAMKTAKHFDFQGPLSPKGNSEMKDNLIKSLKMGRRFSLNGIDDCKSASHNPNQSGTNDNMFECISPNKNDDMENKSDTVSEAGTYTVDKDSEDADNDANGTHVVRGNKTQDVDEEYQLESKKHYNTSWINEWVRDVEEQNLINPELKEPLLIISKKGLENANGSCGSSKIPSPLNTLNRKAKPRSTKLVDGTKVNGSTCHRRSSSLNAKDHGENQGSESSLETESFLRTTESVMTSMQNRMKFSVERKSPDLKKSEIRNFNYKERPHPPSTASDTDTNSETDSKTFKKPIGNPFTSTRLNRAFSLRRAKVDPEKDSVKAKSMTNSNEKSVSAKLGATPKLAAAKPPSSTPFSRLDCGRFSMRSTISGIRSNLTNQKKETKKPTGGNRSSSSLSSREVEFQNWRRRKSFDPMKAAAEGRKKELAKKAAMNHSLTLSVHVGGGAPTRSSGGNPVLRSASFHSTAHVLEGEADEAEGLQEQGSADEQEDSPSFSHFSSCRQSRLHNSPSNICARCKPASRTGVFSSRNSLVSESHSSPSRRLKSEDLENLVLSAISETSYKLKMKSCRLLKKLNYLYEPGEEKSFKIREEIGILESSSNSAKKSPVHQAISRDLSSILKNLKGIENVFNVLEDVLFDESLEIYVNE